MKDKPLTEEERREIIEHRNIILDIREILRTPPGKNFIGYLFKHLEVTDLPPLGMDGPMLNDKLGFLRAGNAIYKIICEADAEVAAALITKNERERYATSRSTEYEPESESDKHKRLYDGG